MQIFKDIVEGVYRGTLDACLLGSRYDGEHGGGGGESRE